MTFKGLVDYSKMQLISAISVSFTESDLKILYSVATVILSQCDTAINLDMIWCFIDMCGVCTVRSLSKCSPLCLFQPPLLHAPSPSREKPSKVKPSSTPTTQVCIFLSWLGLCCKVVKYLDWELKDLNCILYEQANHGKLFKTWTSQSPAHFLPLACSFIKHLG